MKVKRRNKQLITLVIAGLLSCSSMAEGIVASQTTLDFSTEQKFNQITIHITGPNGFNANYDLYDESQLDIDQLGNAADGNYTYKVQYTQNGKTEIINDPTTGRQGAKRNKGNIKTVTGFFNIRDHAFVTKEEAMSQSEPAYQEL
ncbi:hypothetical protein [Shewanella maritima]|uniref:hypothetical protein n=1 Tax=Shewanella maritima TaxID=2520507 RepID=UPI0037361416